MPILLHSRKASLARRVVYFGCGVTVVAALSLAMLTPTTRATLIQQVTFSHDEKRFFYGIVKPITTGATSIRLADITDFDWDTVCLFYGSDITKPIDSLRSSGVLEVDESQRRTLRAIETKSDLRLLAFALRGKLVKLLYHNGNDLLINGRRISLYADDSACINTPSAVFILSRNERFPGTTNLRLLAGEEPAP